MSIIEKIWAGRYSLPLTFWGWHVAGVIAAFIVTSIIIGLGGTIGLFGSAVVVAAILLWGYWLFTCVGVWRSAAPYVSSGANSKKAWGWIARILVCLWTARALWGLIGGGAVAIIALVKSQP